MMKTFSMLTLMMSFAFLPMSMEASPSKYPLNTCIVSDNTLGSMGKVIVKKYQGQEVKFCCKPCVKKFDKNPERYLKRIK